MAENAGEPGYLYPIEDCKSVLGEIVDCGSEVGLHGGHFSYNNVNDLKFKKERLERVLGKKVIGYRNHLLIFKVPDTWECLHEAGFQYDTTLGYVDCIGFRNGMCHPYKPFNLHTGNSIDILEIPLHIMDCTFDLYMRVDLRKAWEYSKRLIDTVAQYNGVLTLSWHNTYFFGDQRKLYEKILRYCSEKNAWLTSAEEISKWTHHHGASEEGS